MLLKTRYECSFKVSSLHEVDRQAEMCLWVWLGIPGRSLRLFPRHSWSLQLQLHQLFILSIVFLCFVFVHLILIIQLFYFLFCACITTQVYFDYSLSLVGRGLAVQYDCQFVFSNWLIEQPSRELWGSHNLWCYSIFFFLFTLGYFL